MMLNNLMKMFKNENGFATITCYLCAPILAKVLAYIFNELFFGGQGCFQAVCIPIIKDLL